MSGGMERSTSRQGGGASEFEARGELFKEELLGSLNLLVSQKKLAAHRRGKVF